MAAIALDELAFRIVESAEPNAWLVVVTDRPSVASSLRDEIERLRGPDEESPVVMTIASVGDLFKAVHAHPRGTMIVIGAAMFSVDHWRSLDANRTRLMRNDITILILDEVSAGRLEDVAPNLASWIGGRVWRLAAETAAPVLSPSEIEQRLAALRSWAGRGDAEVIHLAEAGQLPHDPEYAEWLTLLGRGDLLVS
ncbi:MAG: hypothetical protein E6J90_51030 [Deltaproteobacteria bacterium]|nr:MAG: hypothetical protein E6J90_51030 [Deltaproteobacteria bacterium]